MKIQALLSQLEKIIINRLPWIKNPIPVFLSDVHENMHDFHHLGCALRELDTIAASLRRNKVMTDDAQFLINSIQKMLEQAYLALEAKLERKVFPVVTLSSGVTINLIPMSKDGWKDEAWERMESFLFQCDVKDLSIVDMGYVVPEVMGTLATIGAMPALL